MHLSLGYAGVSDPGAGGGRCLPSSTCPVLRHSLAWSFMLRTRFQGPPQPANPLPRLPTPPRAHLSASVLVSQMPTFHPCPASAPHPCLLTTPSAAAAPPPPWRACWHTSAPGLRYGCRRAQGDQVTCTGASRGHSLCPEVKTLSQPPESRFWLCCFLQQAPPLSTFTFSSAKWG